MAARPNRIENGDNGVVDRLKGLIGVPGVRRLARGFPAEDVDTLRELLRDGVEKDDVDLDSEEFVLRRDVEALRFEADS